MDYSMEEYFSSSSSETSSVDSFEGDDFLTTKGFAIVSQNIGSNSIYDRIHRQRYDSEVDWDVFEDIINHVMNTRKDTFRNIVFTITVGYKVFKRISVTRNRILSKCTDLVTGLILILRCLCLGKFADVYEHYEGAEQDWIDRYGYPMEEFSILTSMFEISYDRSKNISGGQVFDSTYLDYIKTKLVEPIYGTYDCFFDCIHYSLNLRTNLDVLKIRRVLRLSNDVEFPIRLIKKFERHSKIKVTVYKDSICNSKPVELYSSNYKSAFHAKLVLNNSHYYVYDGILPNSLVSNEVPIHVDNVDYEGYIFYDMETYIEPMTFNIVPYMLSYVVCMDGKEYKGVIGKTSIEDDISLRIFIIMHYYMGDRNMLLVGYNNGAFDDYLLINILTNYSKLLSKTIIDSRGRILEFQYSNTKSKDMYKFMIMSLKNATSGFKCDISKGHLDHMIVQNHVYNNTFESFMEENKNKIEEYAIRDVLSLKELYFKANTIFKSINPNLSIDEALTLSQMSMTAFKKSFIKQCNIENNIIKHKLPIIPGLEFDTNIRKALVGGRCQVFNATEEIYHDVQSIDVVSLYPYVMINRPYPYITKIFKNNKWKVDDELIEPSMELNKDKIGIYEITIYSQPINNIIPFRNKDGTLDWDYKEQFTCWSDSVSLNLLKKYNGSFQIHKGYVYNMKMGYIFKDYLKPIIDNKVLQDEYKSKDHKEYNPALRECLKLLMNSLSGKMGQLPFKRDSILCDTKESCNRFINKYKDNASIVRVKDGLWILERELENHENKIKSPTIIAILIYAYAREYMYENFITKVDYKYGMDTDSLFFRADEIYKIDKTLFGNKPGQVKLELPSNTKGIYVMKKIYANYVIEHDIEKIIKFRFKGVSKADKYVPIYKLNYIKDLIRDKSYDILSNEWNNLPDAYNIGLLRDMLKLKQVHIISSQIKRSFRGSTNIEPFNLRGKYTIKTFQINS